MNRIQIIGAGPAGSAAAIAAQQAGVSVTLIEKSRFPRHKVCGEYFSPEVIPVLEALNAWDDFCAAQPACIRRLALHFQSGEKRCNLPEPAFGLSRFRFDDLLYRLANAGPLPSEAAHGARIIAHGRNNPSVRGNRLFGFKAHFTGPVDDAIELFFFNRCYVGINTVEERITNVCGLGPEDELRRFNFDIDALVNSFPKLTRRIGSLNRSWKWLTVGPLVFQNQFRTRPEPDTYLAGDALSFVDPFTGSGLLTALTTGRLAGLAAARRTPVEQYTAECRARLERPLQFSSIFRKLLGTGLGERLAPFVPGPALVWLTRPHRVT